MRNKTFQRGVYDVALTSHVEVHTERDPRHYMAGIFIRCGVNGVQKNSKRHLVHVLPLQGHRSVLREACLRIVTTEHRHVCKIGQRVSEREESHFNLFC